ncbi:MAG: tRNA dihydrouridine synthase DusB [Candidatus Fermentithermobacillus carboniphilus]|uniref:tRNA-dihydrouridine synthase n=1 Tax=Candidatus Fermentithermobacillus carboniphilus TaxID=3085328 RepID=A0AAT9LBR8_9FIRM|nr:MAG: tRNA dihydrouridine synthase DusB [Candidatus Fermentithermobacillus carboniphilus]
MDKLKDIARPLLLGHLSIWPPFVSAPMAGYTDGVFREILREFGCPYCCTEMVSAKGFLLGGDNTLEILEHSPSDRPLAVQLFGEDPEIIARAAAKIQELEYKFDVIDVNMGCPARKITSQGAGGALLKDIPRAQAIVRALKGVSALPVSAKIRLGWDDPGRAVEFAEALYDAGLDLLVVHGRTVSQGYSGRSDWDTISEIARNLPIPVIGNGDVLSPEEALFRLKSSGCSGIMIGRGLLGNPFFFTGLTRFLESGERPPAPSFDEKMSVAAEHFRRAIKRYGERRGLLEMRKHLAFYFKGFRGASRLRELVNREDSPERVLEILEKGWRDAL